VLHNIQVRPRGIFHRRGCTLLRGHCPASLQTWAENAQLQAADRDTTMRRQVQGVTVPCTDFPKMRQYGKHGRKQCLEIIRNHQTIQLCAHFTSKKLILLQHVRTQTRAERSPTTWNQLDIIFVQMQSRLCSQTYHLISQETCRSNAQVCFSQIILLF
jgi:hypothetical protein